MKIVKFFKKLPSYSGHKKVFEINRPDVGLKGFIAIHNNKWGTAVGGTRIFPYASRNDAIADVLRLSSAMTAKCVLSGVPYDGGKSVIIADPFRQKNKNLLYAYAQEINKLKGSFYTGEDVGLSEEDVQFMLRYSPYFIGNSKLAGDPSPYAALSTLYSIQAAAEVIFGSMNLDKKKIAVKGIGKVGMELVRLLKQNGANVIVADIDKKKLNSIKKLYPKITVVNPSIIHAEKVDIYSPCALGDDLNQSSILGLKAKIICGAANNQLTKPEVGDSLFSMGILYIPDYVANAGGLINVVDELNKGGYDKKRVLNNIDGVRRRVKNIILLAYKKNVPPHRITDELVSDALKLSFKNVYARRKIFF